MQQFATEWQTLQDMLDAREWSPHAYRPVAVLTGALGRPRFQITQEQLEHLYSLSFAWNDTYIRNAWSIKNEYIQM